MVADLRSAADLSQAFQHPAVAGGGALQTGALATTAAHRPHKSLHVEPCVSLYRPEA